jgi:NitT/TauT family transport system ATP-binding protein
MGSISFESVSRVYGYGTTPVTAVDNVSLPIGDREFVATVGSSGCGKTTMLRMAAGLDFPISGRVLIGDRSIGAPGLGHACRQVSQTGFVTTGRKQHAN